MCNRSNFPDPRSYFLVFLLSTTILKSLTKSSFECTYIDFLHHDLKGLNRHGFRTLIIYPDLSSLNVTLIKKN